MKRPFLILYIFCAVSTCKNTFISNWLHFFLVNIYIVNSPTCFLANSNTHPQGEHSCAYVILLFDFLGSKWHPLIRADLWMQSITYLCWCNWKTFEKEKCCRKFTKGVSFFRDTAPAHWTPAIQKKLAYLGFQCLDHPPYSPDLAPSDYHLFPGLNK